jgi:hypothetical protein
MTTEARRDSTSPQPAASDTTATADTTQHAATTPPIPATPSATTSPPAAAAPPAPTTPPAASDQTDLNSPTNLLNNLLNSIKENPTKFETITETNSATISDSQSFELIQTLATRKGVNTDVSLVAIAIICQKGGTSKKAVGSIYAVVNGKTFQLDEIRNTISSTGNFKKISLRQWARTNASIIHTISESYGIPGDLFKKISRKVDNVSISDSYWLSNFQMDNPNCPQNQRNLILAHFQDLFPGQSK